MRGLTMAAMIAVNNPGSWAHMHAWVEHAGWGRPETAADLVFPFFLFMVGVSVPLALGRRLERGAARGALARHAARRAARLFAIGLLLALIPRFDLESWRIMGVLQRIGLVYLGCALVFLAGARPREAGILLPASVGGALLVGYWLVLAFAPAPGQPAPGLDPRALSLEGSLPVWLDRQLLAGHLWRDGYDPEGVLSTLPALATGLMGVVAGLVVRRGRRAARGPGRLAARLAALGAGLVAAGLLWTRVLPAEKALWTSSYAALTGGAAALSLALLVWLVDARRSRWWTPPLLAYGVNSLLAFVAAHLGAKLMVYVLRFPAAGGGTTSAHAWIYRHLFLPWSSPETASLLFSLALVLFWLVPLWVLWRRGIRVRI